MGKAKRARRPQGHPAKIESRRLQSAPIRAPRAADALTDEFVAWRQEESSKELTISFFEQLRANAELLGTNEVPVTHAMVRDWFATGNELIFVLTALEDDMGLIEPIGPRNGEMWLRLFDPEAVAAARGLAV
jgi:hypothetical protein